MTESLEVFQDMELTGPLQKRDALRSALIKAAVSPWRVDLEKSAEISRSALASNEDIVLFRREGGEGYPDAGLTLWGTENGYYVPNIVPLKNGQLTYTEYNAILEDFIKRIAEPVALKIGFQIIKTKPEQTLDDWLPSDAVTKLRRFSVCANKSTGASHPADERRWFDFIIAVHRSKKNLGADRLARWLHEVEGWDEDSAHKLAGNYENFLSLLSYYEEN